MDLRNFFSSVKKKGHENEENVEELGFTSDAEELGVTSDMESGNESD